MRYSASDLHLKPSEANDLFPHAVTFLGLADKDDTVVLVGDVLDLLPYGRSAWVGKEPLVTIDRLCKAKNIIVVAGNHDPLPWYSMFVRPSRVTILPEYRWNSIVWTHGHQRSDWGLWRHFAPGFVSYMVEHYPTEWYWICRRLGWLPGQERKKGVGETERFTALTMAIHSAWLKQSEREGVDYIIGHTHKCAEVVAYRPQGKQGVFDGGDLRDGSYIEVGYKVILAKWLKENR